MSSLRATGFFPILRWPDGLLLTSGRFDHYGKRAIQHETIRGRYEAYGIEVINAVKWFLRLGSAYKK